ncbi:MAG TPA: DUF2232 domain-containing protein [Stellaceae bacterium]|jgi:hypothetical protein|nr:DUF2232 domain-containing protein [Stellaceae bacterium]
MNRPAIAAVAAACGAVAGCFYLAATLGTPGALILVYVTQLPLFIAGLWLGASAAAIAGSTGVIVLLAASDLWGAAVFAVMNAAPVVLLVRQALLARRREDGVLVWYPPGLLAGWLVGLAVTGIGAAVLLYGGPQAIQSELQGVVGQVLDRLAERPVPNRDQVAGMLAAIIPGMIAASWMAMSVINAALAQGLLARFRVGWRPSPNMAELGLPLWVPILFGGAAAATVFGGAPRFIGINVVLALVVPFCLAGLAVLHAASRRLTTPTMALVGFYIMASLFGWPFIAVAILGLFESWLGLRHRLAPQGAHIDG